MAFKIPVVDRVSSYPGRVRLTLVDAETNTYDMVRADLPVSEGTAINKALLDNKAYTLTSDVTVYVSPSGSDTDGDGSVDAPFLTIQAAIDALPKHLGGHTATIDVPNGTYDEYLSVKGFTAGKLVIGQYARSITIQGIEVIASSIVEFNASRITKGDATRGSMVNIKDGSVVVFTSGITIDGVDYSFGGINVMNNSVLSASSDNSVTINNCFDGVGATYGARVSLMRLSGNVGMFGLAAQRGGVISYQSGGLTSALGDDVDSGGRIWVGSGLTNFVPASVE